jgi:hypothetical protein
LHVPTHPWIYVAWGDQGKQFAPYGESQLRVTCPALQITALNGEKSATLIGGAPWYRLHRPTQKAGIEKSSNLGRPAARFCDEFTRPVAYQEFRGLLPQGDSILDIAGYGCL